MSKCWYCNEEITSGNNPEHLGICNKCYDEMFKCGNEFVKKMITKMSDLEAKIAESESEVKVGEFWHSAYQGKQLDYDKVYAELRKSYDETKQLKQQLAESEKALEAKESVNQMYKVTLNLKDSDFSDLVRENAKLKQQLAEKEKEIKDLKFMMRNTEQALNNVPNAMDGQRKRIDELTKELKQANQDKISFAVEQLEKVKEAISTLSIADDENHIVPITRDYKNGFICCKTAISKIIINKQIKQLKEGKYD